MTHAPEDSKRRKEINKFQKQRFTYVLQNRCSEEFCKNFKGNFFIELFLWSFFVISI